MTLMHVFSMNYGIKMLSRLYFDYAIINCYSQIKRRNKYYQRKMQSLPSDPLF